MSTSLVLSSPTPADRHPAAVYLAGCGKGSRRTHRGSLETIASLLTGGRANAATLDWAALRYQHTAAIRAALAERYAPETARRMISALRGVLKTAWRLGLMTSDDYTRASDIGSIPGSTLAAGRALTGEEIAALMAACASEPTAAGVRDAALIALLRAAGLRRAEIVALDVADLDRETGRLLIRGKRGKERAVFATNGAALALADWLETRGAESGPLFCPVNRGGRVRIARLSTNAVFSILSKRAEQAGLSDVSPHDLRRTLVSDLLDAGADISTVSQIVGHANVNTTRRYDRRGEAAGRRAVEMLDVPYTPRQRGGA